MRMFIAIELSAEIKDELMRIQNILKSSGADIKWVKPEAMHLTLKFMGEVDETKMPEIKETFDPALSDTSAFNIKLGQIGAFPNLNNLRVLWVGIDPSCSKALEDMFKKIDKALESAGIPKEDKKFSAHLTLGRVRTGKNRQILKDKILSAQPLPKSCIVKEAIIYKSTLTPDGPVYAVIHKVRLK